MANGKISIVDSANAKKELDILYAELDNIEKKILSLDTAVGKLDNSLASIKSVSDLSTKLDALEQSQTKVNAKMSESEKLAARKVVLEEKLVATESELGRQVSVLSKEYTNLISQQKSVVKSAAEIANAKATEKSAYLQLQKKLTGLKKEYRDLAVLQAQDIKLTTQQSSKLKLLTKDITTYDGQLKKVDAGMGVYTRSVGSYGKQFDSLGFSVAQLTRESPAFINSMQTGFMAISNNIPIFVDEINKLTAANKALAAAGEPQKNVWKSVGKALFSWQSLISMAIVLLTVFGPKLIKMARAAISGAKGIDTLAETQEVLNKVLEEGIKSAGREIAQLMILSKAVQDVTKTEKERAAILNEMRDKYGEDIAHLTDREILTNGLAAAEENLKQKILERAMADAAANKIGEFVSELMDLQIKRTKIIDSAVGAQNRLNEAEKIGGVTVTQYGASIDHTAQSQRDFTNSQGDLIDNSKEISLLYAKINELMKFAVKGNLDLASATNKAAKSQKEYLEGSIGWYRKLIAANNELIVQATDNTTRTKLREENVLLQKQLDLIAKARKYIDPSKILKGTMADDGRDPEEKEFTVINDYSESFLEEAVGFADMWQDEMYKAMDATNMFFDNKMERIQQDRDASAEYFDNLISLAGDNEEEVASLEQQKEARDKEYRKKQHEVAKKQAIANKAFAITEITINTARTIAGTLADSPKFDFGISATAASIILGSIAAAQIAAVASAPLPAFKDGTDNAPSGLAIVGDGGKHEYIEDKFGNIVRTPNTDTLVNLSGGETIHKDLDSLSKAKGFGMDSIYQAAVLTSLANESKLSNVKLEKVFDKNLRNLNKDIKQGLRDGFKNVSLHSHTTVDMNHSMYKNDTL